MKVLRSQDTNRLGLDLGVVQRRFDNLRADLTLAQKISAVYAERPRERATSVAAADAGLYGGFIDDADRARCADTLGQLLSGTRAPSVQFDDERLTDLLFRLRARRDDGALDAVEEIRWWAIVKAKLIDGIGGGLTLQEFRTLLETVPDAAGVVAARREHAAHVRG